MASKFLSLSIAGLAASVVALSASAQAALPANVEVDRTTVQQDQALAKSIAQQLKADEAAGNAAAVAADRTALRLARMQSEQDLGKLHQDAQPILQPDEAALRNALMQLHADQAANNASAVQADEAAVTAAEGQLRTDHEAIFGGLGGGFRGHGHHRG